MSDKFLLFIPQTLNPANLTFEHVFISQTFQILIDPSTSTVYKLFPIKNERTVFANQTVYSSNITRPNGPEAAETRPDLPVPLSLVQFSGKPRS